MQLLATKLRTLKVQRTAKVAACEEYLETLQRTEYHNWYWKDRREVLKALKVVLDALDRSNTFPLVEETCVSCNSDR